MLPTIEENDQHYWKALGCCFHLLAYFRGFFLSRPVTRVFLLSLFSGACPHCRNILTFSSVNLHLQRLAVNYAGTIRHVQGTDVLLLEKSMFPVESQPRMQTHPLNLFLAQAINWVFSPIPEFRATYSDHLKIPVEMQHIFPVRYPFLKGEDFRWHEVSFSFFTFC